MARVIAMGGESQASELAQSVWVFAHAFGRTVSRFRPTGEQRSRSPAASIWRYFVATKPRYL